MPLQLGGHETERPRVLTWDPEVPTQVEEAVKTRHELELQGFQPRGLKPYQTWLDKGELVLDPPPKPANQNVMRILSQNGDDRVVWDRTCPDQVKEAFKKFKELLKKGYTAFVVLASGERGHKISEFDPGLQEILLQEGTELVMVPKTVPG